MPPLACEGYGRLFCFRVSAMGYNKKEREQRDALSPNKTNKRSKGLRISLLKQG